MEKVKEIFFFKSGLRRLASKSVKRFFFSFTFIDRSCWGGGWGVYRSIVHSCRHRLLPSFQLKQQLSRMVYKILRGLFAVRMEEPPLFPIRPREFPRAVGIQPDELWVFIKVYKARPNLTVYFLFHFFTCCIRTRGCSERYLGRK